jgi:hypothetical protein
MTIKSPVKKVPKSILELDLVNLYLGDYAICNVLK